MLLGYSTPAIFVVILLTNGFLFKCNISIAILVCSTFFPYRICLLEKIPLIHFICFPGYHVYDSRKYYLNYLYARADRMIFLFICVYQHYLYIIILRLMSFTSFATVTGLLIMVFLSWKEFFKCTKAVK